MVVLILGLAGAGAVAGALGLLFTWRGLRRPDTGPQTLRIAGASTLLAALLSVLAALTVCWTDTEGRIWTHSLAVAALTLALCAIARQWPTSAFRWFVGLVLLLVVLLVVDVGRAATDDDRVAADRITATALDTRLSRAEVRTPTEIASGLGGAAEALRQASAGSTDAGRATAADDVAGAVDELAGALVSASARVPAPQNPTTPLPPYISGEVDAALATLATDPGTALRTAAANLRRELTALQGRLSLHRTARAAQAAIADLCPTSLSSSLPPVEPHRQVQYCPTVTSPPATSPPTADEGELAEEQPPADEQVRTLRQARADATAAVAQVELDASSATGDARTALASALADARVEQAAARSDGADPPVPEALDVVAAADRGATALAAELPGGPWTVSLPVWALLGVLVVAGLRGLEILNAQLSPGPVEFAGDDEAALVLLRQTVLPNLPAPGLQPGSTTVKAVSDLAAVDGVANKLARAALTAFQTVGVPARGYLLTLVLAKPGTAAPPSYDGRAVVTVTSRRTGHTVATLRSTAPGRDEAIVDLGFQAAAVVIGRANGVPPWTTWSVQTAAAYRKHDLLSTADEPPGSPKRIAEAEAASRDAAGSAQLLLLYGYELELGGRPDDARRAYHRASDMWPDYQLARYRAAVAYSQKRDHLKTADVGPGPSFDTKDVFDKLIRDLGLWWVALLKLSIRERSAVVAWRDRHQRRLAVEIAAAVNDTDWTPPAEATSSQSAVVQYNLACLYARRPDAPNAPSPTNAEKVAIALRNALKCPDLDQISPWWLERDPDLEHVRKTADFRTLRAALPETKGSAP